MTTDQDEKFPLLEPDDLGVQRQYLGQLEWRYPSETASVEKSTTIVFRVLLSFDAWGAKKRLRFIYDFIVGRPAPEVEPDFGVWFIADPRFYPAVTPADLERSIFAVLPSAADPLRGG